MIQQPGAFPWHAALVEEIDMSRCKEQTCDLMPGICCLECELAPVCSSACELQGFESPSDCSAYETDETEQMTLDDLLEGVETYDGKT